MYEHIHELDPDTALTKAALRRLVISDEIPSWKVGAKYLVSVEAVTEYLAGTPQVRGVPHRWVKFDL